MRPMASLPDLSTLSHAQKDELILALWLQVQSLTKQLAATQERLTQLEARLSLNLAYPVDCQNCSKMLNWRHGPTRFSDDASRVSASIPR